MAMTTTAAALVTVRRTHARHASALDALEHAFDAEMVINTGIRETSKRLPIDTS